jgi:transcriptional regulator with XRE-family HTH domain
MNLAERAMASTMFGYPEHANNFGGWSIARDTGADSLDSCRGVFGWTDELDPEVLAEIVKILRTKVSPELEGEIVVELHIPQIWQSLYVAVPGVCKGFPHAIVGRKSGSRIFPIRRLDQIEPAINDVHTPTNSISSVISPAASIARVREGLGMSMSAIGRFFDATRQAVYNWQNGAHALEDPQKAERLHALARAADIIKSAGLPANSFVIDRKLPNGKTLVQALKEGADPEVAAQQLIEVVQSGHENRARIERRIDQIPSPDLSTERFGIPSYDEEI